MELSETRASPLGGRSPREDTDQYHLNDLKNQIKLNEKTIRRLEKEIVVQKSQLEVKDDVIEKSEGKVRILEENLLASETEIKFLQKNKKKWDEERKRLQAQVDAANNEADRLNQRMIEYAGSNSDVMNGSMEDTVRLHNQLSQARKDIQSLRGEVKGLENLVKAKDDALEQHALEFAKVEETMASKKEDQNTIVDLKRQIDELRSELGGEHKYGKMAESEIDAIRASLAEKEEELDAALEKLDAQREQIIEAKRLKAEADQLMVAASTKMAEAVSISERAVAAEAERMRSGGYVEKGMHNAEVMAMSSELEECKKTIDSMKQENTQARLLLERLLDTADCGIEEALSRDDVVEKFGNSVIAIQELRKEIKYLQDLNMSKEGIILSLRASKAAADARAQKSVVSSLHAKQHLAKALGEFDYTLLMNEPVPTEDDIQVAKKQLDCSENIEECLSYTALHKEQLKLQGENIVLSKNIQECDARIEQVKEEASKSITIALAQATQQVEQHKAVCMEKEDEILHLKATMEEQATSLENVKAEGEIFKQEMILGQKKEIENIRLNHSSVVAEMEEKHTSLVAEMEAVKSSNDEVASKLLATKAAVDPVLIQLHIEIKETQRSDIGDLYEENHPVPEGQDAVTPKVAVQEDELDMNDDSVVVMEEQDDPITPRQSKVFESSLEESPQRQFAGQQDAGIVSPEALSRILDALVETKESRKDVQGDELYGEAIAMLQEELSRLSLEMASDNDMAAKLRGELGDLKTAQLSAKTTAEILESYNAMSMKLAAHKSMAAQRENVFARHEQQLLNEISDLRMEIRRLKGKSALKSVKKAFSSTVRGIKKSLDTTPKSVSSISPLGDTLSSLDAYSPSNMKEQNASPRGGLR